jgi:hypothetical protein
MAKKTRKPNLPQETLERARREMARRGVAPVAETPAVAQPAASQAKQAAKPTAKPAAARRYVAPEVDLSEEYAYVLRDLKNMGLLAAVLGAFLVAASVFI